MDLHARVIRAAIGSAAKIADACGSRADHDNFFLKSAWGKLFLENVHDGVVGESACRTLIVDHHLAAAIRVEKECPAKLYFDDPLRAVDQIHVLSIRSNEGARGHQIQRRVDIPLVWILRAPI